MATRTKKTVTTSLPQEDLAALDRVRKQENRSRSELMREALRHYVALRERIQRIPEVDPEPDETEAIERGRKAIERGEYVTLDDLLHEMGIHR